MYMSYYMQSTKFSIGEGPVCCQTPVYFSYPKVMQNVLLILAKRELNGL